MLRPWKQHRCPQPRWSRRIVNHKLHGQHAHRAPHSETNPTFSRFQLRNGGPPYSAMIRFARPPHLAIPRFSRRDTNPRANPPREAAAILPLGLFGLRSDEPSFRADFVRQALDCSRRDAVPLQSGPVVGVSRLLGATGSYSAVLRKSVASALPRTMHLVALVSWISKYSV